MQQFESFAQMQRDAAMRVMEMQKRAQAAMRQYEQPPELPVAAGDSFSQPLMEPVTENSEPPAENIGEELSDASREDSELALITAILLLLIREKADQRLIFALLYILM